MLVQHTRLKSGIQGESSFCSLGKYADCDVVNSSTYSELFGVPLASFGALAYFLILIFGLSAPPNDRNYRPFQRLIGWLGSASATCDLLLLLIQILLLHTLCIVCILSYGATFLILYTCISGNGITSVKQFRQFLTERWGFDFRWQSWTVLTCSIISFVGTLAFLPATIQMIPQKQYAQARIEQFFSEFKDKPSRVIEAKDGDGTFGNPSSRVRIVEFSDFECPHCQRAAFTLHNSLETLGERVYFIFKHYPLDSTCNNTVTYQLHPKACKLAQLAYCAAKRNLFWEFHDTIFFDFKTEELPEWDLIYGRLAEKQILSREEITRCLQNDKAIQNVLEDIRLGNSFGIKGTPTVLINGKAVTISITVESLRKLIEIEER